MSNCEWAALRSVAGLIALLLLGETAWGQVAPPLVDPTLRSGEQPPLQREAPRPQAPAAPILPPLAPEVPRGLELTPGVQVLVRDIRVTGSTVFSAEQFAEITKPYVNRTLTHEDLEALRLALTLLYVNRGYVNSGAVLPDQTVADGVVTYRIVEGAVTDINIEGNRWFRPGYLQRRIALGAGPPLNVNELQERFQLLLDDQRLQRLGAELKPGARPGEATLVVQVEERDPYRISLDLNNHQSPSVGSERAIVSFEHGNATGNGDMLRLQYGRSSGLNPLLDFKYTLPVSARDTALVLQYRKNTFSVVEEPFDHLDIRSKSDIYSIGIRHPVHRTRDREIALEATAERLSNRTALLGTPFSLSPGAQQGESVSTALRFAQELIHRSTEEVIAFRSRFSVGVNALEATVNADPNLPSAKFVAWLGQFQWVRRLPGADTQFILRADTQLTPDPLFAIEQFAVGGRYTVRGYRENTFVRDNALVASAEARIPLVRNVAWAESLELAPFVDYGKAWNAKPLAGERTPHIWSAGVGLRWNARIPGTVPLRPQLEVYWGRAMRNIPTAGGDLQDKGVHLQFVVSAF